MTAGTSEYPHIKCYLLAMSTLTACLTRIGRIDFHQVTASFCRFARQPREERRPRGICNAFGKTMIVQHAVDGQILNGNDTKSIDNGTACLVREVVTPPRYPLMHAGNHFPLLVPLWGALCQCAVLALHLYQSLFFLAEKARVRNFFPSGQGGKGQESYVNAHLLGAFWQAKRFDFTGERGIPFPGTAFVDGERFDGPAHRAMVDHLDTANLREADPVIMGDGKARLREREGVIAALPLEAREPRFRSLLAHTAEEGLESQLYPLGHILQDLRMDVCEGRTFSFEQRNACLRLIPGNVLLSLFPGILPVGQRLIVEPAALLKDCLKSFLLFPGWVHAVLVHLPHTQQYNTILDTLRALSNDAEGDGCFAKA